MRVVVIEGPALAVSVADAKRHLRIADLDGDGNVLAGEDDDYVEGLVRAAQMHIDGPSGWLGRAVGVQTLEARLSGFECDPVALPYRPVLNVVGIRYEDRTGELQTLPPEDYELRGEEVGTAWGKRWPATRAYRGRSESVRITYRAGYEEVPAPIRQAILLLVGHWYANRETVNVGNIVNTMPLAFEALLAPYRVWSV